MHKYSVALRISGPSLDPKLITDSLGLDPTRIVRVGDRLSKGRIAENGSWDYEVRPSANSEWSDLEAGLNALLTSLLDRKAAVQDLRKAFEVCLWCAHFSSSFDGGPTFSVELLSKLAEFGVPLYLDTYCSDADSN